ncbi:Transposase IS4 [Popillia japonica]|uniref:Transposase IS4 n=1 Tax=Popillia japonica TaxID=7064 RepID=A0AAW1J085_POPJA
MVTATNRTYLQRQGREFGMTVAELKKIIGVQMSKEYGIEVIKTAMTRRRFFNIRSSLKVVFDDDVTAEEKSKNKIWKVALLFDSVLFGCRSQERPIHLSIDEMIVPFSGQCGIRQYCPGKPNPVGIKIFVLASPDGIVLDMLPYQGKTTFPDLIDAGYTLGEAAIIRLCDTLVPGHFL